MSKKIKKGSLRDTINELKERKASGICPLPPSMEGYNPITGSDVDLLDELLPNEPSMKGRLEGKVVRKSGKEK